MASVLSELTCDWLFPVALVRRVCIVEQVDERKEADGTQCTIATIVYI